MNKITRDAFRTVSDILAVERAPWVVLHDGVALIACPNRTMAREAKVANGFNGQVMKYDETQFELEIPPAPVEQSKAEIVRKSTATKPCRLVWDMAEKMQGARRKDIVAACVAAGVAFYTARTQYQMWLTVRKEERAREEAQAKKV